MDFIEEDYTPEQIEELRRRANAIINGEGLSDVPWEEMWNELFRICDEPKEITKE
jgi:hypothetical protein